MIIGVFKPHGKKELHKVLSAVPHLRSMASFLLLKRQYQKEDPEYKARSLSPRIWLTFRNRLLRKMKKANKGILICTYCKNKNLTANFNLKNVKYSHKATLDHVLPVSRGGKKFDLTNLVVACSRCNHKKADKILIEGKK